MFYFAIKIVHPESYISAYPGSQISKYLTLLLKSYI